MNGLCHKCYSSNSEIFLSKDDATAICQDCAMLQYDNKKGKKKQQ